MRRVLALCVVWLLTNSLLVSLDAAPPKSNAFPWRSSLPSALQEAKRTRKPVMLYFHASWCAPCHAMERETFSDAAVKKEAQQWISVKIDLDSQAQLARQYKIKRPPMIVLLKPDGKEIKRLDGFLKAAPLLKSLKSARASKSK